MFAWIPTLALLASVGSVSPGSADDSTASSTAAPATITESEDWLNEPLDLPGAPGNPSDDGLLAAVEALARHIDFGGKLQSNIRYRPDDKTVGEWFNRFEQPPRFVRNEQILKLKMNANLDRFAAVFDIDLVWLGFSRDTHTLEDLSVRERVEPQRFEAHAAYLDATDILFEGLDLRIGHQIVAWGAGDQFNPTNNLNADDLEDRLLFGVQQANLMARADYSIGDAFSISGVVVPIFRPALLPASASVGLRQVDRLPMVDAGLRYRLHTEREAARLNGLPTIVTDAEVVLPETNLENMQFGFRLATTLLNTDIAFTYYQGFSDIPEAFENTVVQVDDPSCNPNDEEDCIQGRLETSVRLGYPKFRVLGLNIAGEIDILGAISDVFEPIGFRLEVGVFFPERQRLRIFQGEVELFDGFPFAAGEYDYDLDGEPGGGLPPTVIDTKPYAKWTLGLDYSIGEHFYINAMWVHGLVDEVGVGIDVRRGGIGPLVDLDRAFNCTGRLTQDELGQCADETFRNNIGDYLVLGVDFKWNGERGLLRLFGVLDLTGYERSFYSVREVRIFERFSPFSAEGFSASLFPELNYNFGSGLELGVGGLLNLGKIYTKFGDPAAGGSLVWTRARLSF